MSIILAARPVRQARRLFAAFVIGLMAMVGATAAMAQNAYVGNFTAQNVSVIQTSNNTLLTTVTLPGGGAPFGVAVTPDGARVYVTNQSGTVSVIQTSDNTVVATVTLPGGSQPVGVAVTPNGAKVYVANYNAGTVSVIQTSDNTVLATVTLPPGSDPIAFGKFIGPAPAPPPATVPTLSEWAMILFGLMLAGGAAVMIQRRRQLG